MAENVRRVALASVGCKTNQYEAIWLAGELRKRGMRIVEFDERADAYVIFTCAVTQRAEADSRKLIHRARRRNPDAFVVATGCGVQLEPRAYLGKDGAHVAVGMNERERLAAIIEAGAVGQAVELVDREKDVEFVPFGIDQPELIPRSRAWLKIQEGCGAACSYCVVPRLRGRPRSVPVERILKEAEVLSERFAEIVLVGTNIGQFGLDLQPRIGLVALLRRLLELAERKGFRIRLSSIEPMEFDAELVELALAAPLCPHFHIPLQGTTDRVLSDMNRPYTAGEYAGLVESIRAKIPHASIGTDIISGFPTESERDFEEGLKFFESLPVSYAHIFSYSPRPGTPAAELVRPLPASVVRKRTARLKGVDAAKRASFAASQVGRKLELVVTRSSPGGSEGLSENYLRVRFPQRAEPGSLVVVRAVSSEGPELKGELVDR